MTTATGRLTWRCAAAATLVALVGGQVVGLAAAEASPRTAIRTSPSVDGTVFATAQSKGRTLIGGSFTTVGSRSRPDLAAVQADGSVDPTWDPRPNGVVRAIAVSADGSVVFIGGDFTQVDGLRRRHLAAVDAVTGDVLPGFRPAVSRTVLALAVSGDALYVGGRFGTIGGQPVPRLARLDAASGAVDATFVPAPDARVRAIAVSPDGSKVYPVGGFTTIAGLARPGVAELGAGSGSATSFSPSEGGDALAVAITSGGGRFFVSLTNHRTLAFDPRLSDAPVYTVRTDGNVQAIAVGAKEVYIGGRFSALTDFRLDRPGLASFLVVDGTPTSWRVTLSGGGASVWTIRVAQKYLAVGGDFMRVNGKPQRGFVRFDGTP